MSPSLCRHDIGGVSTAGELPLPRRIATAAPLLRAPTEIIHALPSFFSHAQPLGRLATTTRALAADCQDASGRLRVNSIVTCRLRSAVEGLQRASLQELEEFRLDLTGECRDLLTKHEIERAMRLLSESLANASALQVLAVRMAAFDTSMERIRLGPSAWEALIRGLGQLSEYGKLRCLELSSITIKTSRATQDVSMSEQSCCISQDDEDAPSSPPRRVLRRAATSPTRGAGAAAASAQSASSAVGAKLSFLEALSNFSNLEELSLTHDEIVGSTAMLLSPVFQKLVRLKRVDLTRNHIQKQVMEAIRIATPRKVELRGDDMQTFFFY